MGPRISYVQPSTVKDEAMLAEFDRCAREGTPRPESQAIRAHVPATFWSFAITWDLPPTDEIWARLHKHFSEPELVEIGYFIAITMGQQRWLRTLNIEHHQVLAGTDASMAPGFRTEEELKRSKAQPDYWAKKPAQPQAAE